MVVVVDVAALATCIAPTKDPVPPTCRFSPIPTPPPTFRAPVVVVVDVAALATCMVPAKLAFPLDASIVAASLSVSVVVFVIVKSLFALRVPLVPKADAKKPTPSLLIEANLSPTLYIESPP